MKKIHTGQRLLARLWAAVIMLMPLVAQATDYPIDPSSANNGLLGIYSATFDPPLDPGCGPGTLTAAECAFFGGQTPATQEITIVPTPTFVATIADTSQCVQDFPNQPEITPPCATLYASPTPSALDLTLSAGNTQLAINGGDAFFPNLTIVISNGTASQTDVFAKGASIINFVPSSGTVPVDGNGVAVFEVDVAPGLAADFATFSQIVTSCTGPLCALIPILTLDMVRYRLTIDWDPTFTFFTANFIGQTANNSLVFATLDSIVPGTPEITVTDSIAPIDDLQVPFGDIPLMTFADQTVTVTNDGSEDLVLGDIAQIDPLVAPFSIESDACALQSPLAPSDSCELVIRFSPVANDRYEDSFDIPSNDPNESSVVVRVSGGMMLPDISVIDTVPPTEDLSVAFGDVTEGTAWDRTITIRNDGTANLQLGMLAQTDTLGGAFSILSDNCSAQIIAPAGSCVLMVRFLPASVGDFSDSFDIPSNDPDEAVLVFTVSGTGVLLGTGTINLNPDGADSGAFGSAAGPFTLWALLSLIAVSCRRRF